MSLALPAFGQKAAMDSKLAGFGRSFRADTNAIIGKKLTCEEGRPRRRFIFLPTPVQPTYDRAIRVVGAQAGAQVDVNVRVTTGGAASASAQPNGRPGRQRQARSPTLQGSLARGRRRRSLSQRWSAPRGARAPQEAEEHDDRGAHGPDVRPARSVLI